MRSIPSGSTCHPFPGAYELCPACSFCGPALFDGYAATGADDVRFRACACARGCDRAGELRHVADGAEAETRYVAAPGNASVVCCRPKPQQQKW